VKITESKKENIFILGLKGRLDSTTSDDLESKILGLADEGEKRFTIDCSNLDYISSSGLKVLLLGAEKLKNVGVEIVIFSLKDNIKEVFDCAGFS